MARGLLLLAASCAALSCENKADEKPAPPLAETIEQLSEPGGYFDTDNIISNETSYIQALDLLKPSGGAYIGVGPEQNFTYIGRLRPEWAFILDIRRQNMLQHLLFNAIFEQAATPFEFLCWLLSRSAVGVERPSTSSMEEVVAAVESLPSEEETFEANLRAIYGHVGVTLAFDLSALDRRRLRSIYRTFFREQFGTRFQSHGRPPMPYHPDLRSLLLARTPQGREANFLATLEDYDYVRSLARSGRLVPVVGDFAGPDALRRIGDFIRARGHDVSAFYVSNVEFYLLRSGNLADYVDNVRTLPLDGESLFIRAYFDYGRSHPAALPGHRSTTILQPIHRFLSLYDAGRFRNYWDISTIGYLK